MKDNVLKIILWGDEVGKIYWDSKNMTSIFNYNPDFVKKGLDIAPFTASIHSPLGKGHPYVSPSLKFEPKYKGLPYFLSDSLLKNGVLPCLIAGKSQKVMIIMIFLLLTVWLLLVKEPWVLLNFSQIPIHGIRTQISI